MRRLDVLRLLRIVGQRLPDLPDADLERRVPDKDVRPGGVEEFLLRHEASGVQGEIEQHTVGFGRERHEAAIPPQPGAGAIQSARSEEQSAVGGRGERLR